MTGIKKTKLNGDVLINNVISLSGGKDSTAMPELMLEYGEKIHSAVFFDTGWEFPAMHDQIDLFEKKTGIKVVRIKPKKSFAYWMHERPVKAKYGKLEIIGKELMPRPGEFKNEDDYIDEYERWEIDPYKYKLVTPKGAIHRIGNGWPSPMRRWCTRQKVYAIDKYLKTIENPVTCIGFAYDEQKRIGSVSAKKGKYEKRYPLVEYGVTEAEALKYCRDKGYHWGGLYEHFNRVSCFCCPLQKIGDLRTLRKFYPELWAEMLDMDSKIQNNRGFKGDKTVHDLERRFASEDKQMELF